MQIFRKFGKPRKTDHRHLGSGFARSDSEQQHGTIDVHPDASLQHHPVPPAKTQLTESTQWVLPLLHADVRCSSAERAREYPVRFLASYLIAARLFVNGGRNTMGAFHARTRRVAWKRRQRQCERKCCATEKGQVRMHAVTHGADCA